MLGYKYDYVEEQKQKALGARLLGRQNMHIDTYGAIELINKYFKEGLS